MPRQCRRGRISRVRQGQAQCQKQKMIESFSPFIIVSREEVQAQNTSSVLRALRSFLKSPAIARTYSERLEIAFHGYDNHAEELFEIQEVREFVHLLDEEFPFWLCQATSGTDPLAT